MSIIGFDTIAICTDYADAAAAAGAKFACRYLRNLTIAEAQALSAAGLKIVSIFEHRADRALAGSEAGMEDGRDALQKALNLGQPTGSAICATADFDVTPVQEDIVLAYLAAFRTAISGFKLMVYANGAILQALLDENGVDYTWLAGGMGMRGSLAFSASGQATIIQDVGDRAGLDFGVSIDSDAAYSEDYGGWQLPA